VTDKDTAALWFASQFYERWAPGIKTDLTLREVAYELLDRAREIHPEFALSRRCREVLADVRLHDHGDGVYQQALCDAACLLSGSTSYAVRHHLYKLEQAGYIRRARDEEGRLRVHAIRP
jgi:DNA-binding transcriptional ArsR family regulator